MIPVSRDALELEQLRRPPAAQDAPLRCAGPCPLCDDGPAMVNAQRRETRSSWLSGHCPCCGGPICPWLGNWPLQQYDPQPVAEGVRFCGRCIGNGHHTAGPGNALPHILTMLLPDPANGIY